MCIWVGKEPEVEEWAVAREFLLSINILLMCHITPKMKYQEAAETIHLFSNHLIQELLVRILKMHVD